MDFSSKRLLWSEGTLLAQQHFQQWDSMQESRHKFWYYFNKRRPREGFLNLEIEASVLAFGIFRIKNFQAISREGEVFGFQSDLNHYKSLELDLNTVEFSNSLKQGDILTVYIAIPKGSNSHGVSGYPKRNILQARWVAEYSNCVDEMDVERQQEVLFGHLNVQLLINCSSDFNKRKSENALLVAAELIYSGSGRYALNSEFMPSILRLGASNWLIAELRNLGLYLQFTEKSLILKITNIKGIGDKLNEWRARELLEIISLLRYRISTWLSNPNIDPDEVIDTIMQSIIKAKSLSISFDTIEMVSPSAETKNLYEVFSVALGSLKEIFGSILPIKQKNIRLTESSGAWLSSEFLVEEVVEMADLYLSVSFKDKIGLVDQFVKETKLSGGGDIQRIITQALPGLTIQNYSKNINFFVNDKKRSYFKISKTGQHWDDVRDTGKICIFVSKKFSDLDIQLMATFEDEKYVSIK